MEFEFDPLKSVENRAKHGIDFARALHLWSDPALFEIPARTTDEPRWLVLATLEGRIWTAVITRRGATIRIISVRRARAEEEAWYESQGP